jgi:hypothetical protein
MQLNTSQFVEKARKIHGDLYDYSQSEYTKSSEKIKIKCPTHGIFEQAAGSHLNKRGCPSCGKLRRFAAATHKQQDVIDRFNKIHCNKYDYSNVLYVSSHTKIIISCPTHGQFEQRPYDHWNGHGCDSCGGVSANIKKISEEKSIINTEGISLFQLRYQKIHNKRRNADNYKLAGKKAIKTLRSTILEDGSNALDARMKKLIASKTKNGYCTPEHLLPEIAKYRKKVYYQTKKSIKNFGHHITSIEDRGHIKGKDLDHQYSILHGFQNNIDPKIIGHIANLRVITSQENRSKNCDSSILLDDLLIAIQNFDENNAIWKDRIPSLIE